MMFFFQGCIPVFFEEQKSFVNFSSSQGEISRQNSQVSLDSLSVRLKNGETINFSVEIARDESSRNFGLMFRQNLEEKHGMFFVFEKPAILSFWMKNTLIPLDMIFVDEHFKIIHIQKNARPCKQNPCELYHSPSPAQYVLEIGGGESERFGIEVGDGIQYFP